MRIETDRYLITSDAHNVITQVKGITKDSPSLKDKSKIGKVSLGDKRFHPNLKMAYQSLANQLTLESETVKSLDDVAAIYEQLIEDVKAI